MKLIVPAQGAVVVDVPLDAAESSITPLNVDSLIVDMPTSSGASMG